MSIVSTRVVRNSTGGDVDLAVVGSLEPGEKFHEVIVKPPEFGCTYVKLNALFHSIQSGIVLLLYWEGESEHTLMLPIEGRGILDLSRFGGLDNPRFPGATGNVVLACQDERSTGSKRHFALSLEFSKQRS